MLELSGKIVQFLPSQTGTSQRGEWKKDEFVIETQENYPKKICLTNWNNKIDLSNLTAGTMIKASVNIESKEFKGRWYTEIRVWKLDVLEGDSTVSEPPSQFESGFVISSAPSKPDDDLPF